MYQEMTHFLSGEKSGQYLSFIQYVKFEYCLRN